ncbi:MAG: very short patch repair endonuclease [Terriglobia bacterium]
MDVFAPETRSEIMRRVRSKDTTPEIAVRRLVSAMGFRYRLHSKTLTGHPDLVFSRLRKAIFVHGCFWHGHSCRSADLPASNRAYWKGKRARNASRDRRARRGLRGAGWKLSVLREYEPDRVLKAHLESRHSERSEESRSGLVWIATSYGVMGPRPLP